MTVRIFFTGKESSIELPVTDGVSKEEVLKQALASVDPSLHPAITAIHAYRSYIVQPTMVFLAPFQAGTAFSPGNDQA
jgi:hypothetical protein